MNPEVRLRELGLELPPVPPPAGSYVPWVRSGNLLFTSGTLPLRQGQLVATGKVGREVTLEQAQEAARVCAINLLAVLRDATGDLDHVRRIVSVTGYVNAAPDFTLIPQVINGASNLLVEVFGDRGRHTRAAVGAVSLPLGASVEVQLVAEL